MGYIYIVSDPTSDFFKFGSSSLDDESRVDSYRTSMCRFMKFIYPCKNPRLVERILKLALSDCIQNHETGRPSEVCEKGQGDSNILRAMKIILESVVVPREELEEDEPAVEESEPVVEETETSSEEVIGHQQEAIRIICCEPEHVVDIMLIHYPSDMLWSPEYDMWKKEDGSYISKEKGDDILKSTIREFALRLMDSYHSPLPRVQKMVISKTFSSISKPEKISQYLSVLRQRLTEEYVVEEDVVEEEEYTFEWLQKGGPNDFISYQDLTNMAHDRGMTISKEKLGETLKELFSVSRLQKKNKGKKIYGLRLRLC